MFMLLVENIEKELQRTSKMKIELNSICDVSWDLLSPPGSGNEGKFIVKKPITDLEAQRNSECNSSSSIDIYKDVTDLINYGKLVRSNEKAINTKSSDAVSRKSGNNNKSTIDGKKCLEKTSSRNKKLTLRREVSSSLDSKVSGSNNINRGLSAESRSVDLQPSTHRTASQVFCSHTCSLLLSERICSLKMPEDLNHMLKLYDTYVKLRSNLTQNVKSKHKDLEQLFSRKFKAAIKLKLQSDLQSTNQYEKQMKYIDLLQEGVKSEVKIQSPPLQTECRSREQYELFEAKSHRLLELQLQSKLLNIIIGCFSESDIGSFE